jgi:hypothetical protein
MHSNSAHSMHCQTGDLNNHQLAQPSFMLSCNILTGSSTYRPVVPSTPGKHQSDVHASSVQVIASTAARHITYFDTQPLGPNTRPLPATLLPAYSLNPPHL